jgi:hypothetical protein
MPRETDKGSIERSAITTLVHVRLNDILDGITNFDQVYNRCSALGVNVYWDGIQNDRSRSHDSRCHHSLYQRQKKTRYMSEKQIDEYTKKG